MLSNPSQAREQPKDELVRKIKYDNKHLLIGSSILPLQCTDLSSAVCDSPVVSPDCRLRPGLNVAPRALVFVLFLRKDQLCVGVLLAFLFAQVKGERTDLLNSRDGNLVLET